MRKLQLFSDFIKNKPNKEIPSLLLNKFYIIVIYEDSKKTKILFIFIEYIFSLKTINEDYVDVYIGVNSVRRISFKKSWREDRLIYIL